SRPLCFSLNHTSTPEIYTLSLHDALPIYADGLSFIFLNPVIQESSKLYRCTFAHELGHYYATVAGMPGDDELALKWARRIVLPDSWVLPRRHMNPARLAEEADVYEEWVAARIRDIWNRLSGRFCALKGDVKC